MSARMPALFAAQSVAMNAITGSLTLHMVDDLRTKAEELLPRGDDLRCAILTFATQYEVHRRDDYAMRKFGAALQAAVTVVLNPDVPAPTLRHRADIDD